MTLNVWLATANLPLLEARMLAMRVLNLSRVQLITRGDMVLDPIQTQTLEQLRQRRQLGEPMAYILGEREFFGLRFEVSPAVLIPRPETELLVELALQRLPVGASVLDMGTGSGAIAITLAVQRPDLQVWALDISENALIIARRNAELHGVSDRLHFLHSDWFQALPAQCFAAIVSNPPYIEQHDPHLTQGDLRFEPQSALTDHADGLSAYRHLIAGAHRFLAPQAWLLMEHGYDQAATIRTLLSRHGFTDIQSWNDLASIERASGGRRTA